jgi:ribonuclease P protein component
VKNAEVLRRRDLFRQIAVEGTRIDAQILRCMYLVRQMGDEPLQVAFKVPSRKLNAVRRNRIKRLMREAFRNERSHLKSSLGVSHSQIAMFFSFKGAKVIHVEQLKLNDVQQAISELCGKICSSLEKQK